MEREEEMEGNGREQSLGRAGAIFEISNPDLRCRCEGPGQCRGRGV